MELGVFIVFVSGFFLCAGLVFVFSFFGIQGETFEEALEAQRKKLNSEKKKEKKKDGPTEKKKKGKKGKDKEEKPDILDEEDDTVIVEPAAAEKVERVVVESLTSNLAVEKAEPVPKKEKKREAKKQQQQQQAAKKEEEPVVEVVEVVEAKPVAVVEEKLVQQSEPEAVVAPVMAEPENEPKKKKMEIVEVASAEADPVPAEKEAEEKKKKPAKEKKPKAAAPPTVAGGAAKSTTAAGGAAKSWPDLLSVVRQASLTDKETQAIIDVLLLKQSGKVDTTDEWIEQGKESEAKKTARQLSELQVAFNDEKEKSVSLEKKLATIRRELNEEKSFRANHQRIVDDLNQKRSQEIANLNSRLQQSVSQLNNTVALNHQLETNQTHYQTTINNLQSKVTSGGTDPLILSELEQLRNVRTELTQNNSNLQQQLATKSEEVDRVTAANKQLEQLVAGNTSESDSVKKQLAAKEAEMAAKTGELEKKLAGKTDEVEQLLTAAKAAADKQLEMQQLAGKQDESSHQLAGVTAAKTQLESQLSAVTAAKQQLQLELSVLKDKLTNKESENSRLLEENERLSEQFASSVERPAAEGEEAGKLNGHGGAQGLKESLEVKQEHKDWEEKLQKLSGEHEKILSLQKGLEQELVASKEEINKLNAKNDETVKALEKEKADTASLLTRIFPSISSFSDRAKFEKEAKKFLQDLESESGKGDDLTEEVTRLEGQVVHYKTVLEQTESMLTSLQASVESAETEWKKKLENATSSDGKLRTEFETLKTKTSGLEKELESLKAKEKEVSSLTAQLESERKSKSDLAKKCTELQVLVSATQQQLETQKHEDLCISNGTSAEAAVRTPLGSGEGRRDSSPTVVPSSPAAVPTTVGAGAGGGGGGGGGGAGGVCDDSASITSSLDSHSDTPTKKKKSKKNKLLGFFKQSKSETTEQ